MTDEDLLKSAREAWADAIERDRENGRRPKTIFASPAWKSNGATATSGGVRRRGGRA